MAAKKCCSCPLFSCFSHKKNTTFTHTHSFVAPANPFPEAIVTGEESRVTSSTTVAALPNVSHDSQHRSPPAAASSQPTAPSHMLPSFSQATVTSAALPASSQAILSPHAHRAHDKVSEVGSSSASLPKESDHAKNTREAAHSSEIAPSSLNVIANASPTAALTVEERHVTSATAASPPNASGDIVGQDSQPSSSSAAASSQPNTSKDPLLNDLQSIAPSALPSSSQPTVTSFASPTSSQTIVSPLAHPAHDKGFQVGSSSNASSSKVGSSSNPSSSSVAKESDHAQNIREAAGAIDKENVDADLDELSNYISRLFDFIEEEKEKKTGDTPSEPKAAKDSWLASQNFIKLKEVLSEGINAVKDVLPGDTNTFIRGFFQNMGMAHMVTTGFLVVANILERYEAISTNKEACLSLLKEMNMLARHVKELQKRPELKEAMKASIKEATVLMVEASVACCTQINKKKFSKFFSTNVDGEELAKFKTTLTETDTHMQRQMN